MKPRTLRDLREAFEKSWTEWPLRCPVPDRNPERYHFKNACRAFWIRGTDYIRNQVKEPCIWRPLKELGSSGFSEETLVEVLDLRVSCNDDGYLAVLRVEDVLPKMWTHFRLHTLPLTPVELELWEKAWAKIAGSPNTSSAMIGDTRWQRLQFRDAFLAIEATKKSI